ncbi:hypothetical protein DFP73DRAFT_590992 [Morchella snyderi]|nr:hypothetical protein DFP73DRAFT_590992 [Morchella snyderi]
MSTHSTPQCQSARKIPGSLAYWGTDIICRQKTETGLEQTGKLYTVSQATGSSPSWLLFRSKDRIVQKIDRLGEGKPLSDFNAPAFETLAATGQTSSLPKDLDGNGYRVNLGTAQLEYPDARYQLLGCYGAADTAFSNRVDRVPAIQLPSEFGLGGFALRNYPNDTLSCLLDPIEASKSYSDALPNFILSTLTIAIIAANLLAFAFGGLFSSSSELFMVTDDLDRFTTPKIVQIVLDYTGNFKSMPIPEIYYVLSGNLSLNSTLPKWTAPEMFILPFNSTRPSEQVVSNAAPIRDLELTSLAS